MLRDLETKLVPFSEIEKTALVLKKSQKRIVTTNGCFDLVHLGHIQYLLEAKRLGDVLIVGINSDSSVKKLKGPKRPLCDERTRALQIAGLESVDYVVVFEQDTPELLLEKIKPQIHVKGGDYSIDRLPERKVVESGGGKVVCVSLTDGYSTTKLVEKIKSF